MSRTNPVSLELNDPGFGGDPFEQKVYGPDFSKPIDESVDPFIDPKFEQRPSAGGDGKGLRRFLDRPLPDSVLAELAERTGGPQAEAINAELTERREENAAIAFRQAHPEYVVSESNYSYLREYLEKNGLAMSAANHETAFNYGIENGELPDLPEGTSRELSSAELLLVQRTAAQGGAKISEAIILYLKYALPSLNDEDVCALLADPSYVDLTNTAVMVAFSAATPEFPNTEEAAAAILAYAAGRPLNYQLCVTAWNHVKDGVLYEPEVPENPVTELENLSDKEISQALRGVSQLRASQR
jgi:hypothetical protein